MKKHTGFTLAETLITLVIVGIIAALTIPNLIAKYQKEQTITRLKKVYSTLSQTTAKAIADNGPIISWEIGPNYNADSAINFINKYMIPYLSVQNRPTTQSVGHWNNYIYYLNGSKRTFQNYWVKFTLNDGVSITSHIDGGELIMCFDINGDKKPNRYGRDIFEFGYFIKDPRPDYNGKMLPTGFNRSREQLLQYDQWACNKNNTGTTCSSLIVKDGWKISDDYPW